VKMSIYDSAAHREGDCIATVGGNMRAAIWQPLLVVADMCHNAQAQRRHPHGQRTIGSPVVRATRSGRQPSSAFANLCNQLARLDNSILAHMSREPCPHWSFACNTTHAFVSCCCGEWAPSFRSVLPPNTCANVAQPSLAATGSEQLHKS